MHIYLCTTILLLSIFLILGCNKSYNPIEHTSDSSDTQLIESGVSGLTKLQYQYLGTAPIHTQTSMLAQFQNSLYRIGSRWPIQILNLSSHSWAQVQLPDSTYWRWDGAAITVGDTIYIIAVYENKSYDLLSFHPGTAQFKHTNVKLPKGFFYPAYGINQDKIVFLATRTDSMFEFNPINSSLRKIARNPFYDSSSVYNPTLTSHVYNGYFYVFDSSTPSSSPKFYKLNLNNYQWETISYPASLQNSYVVGSAFGSHLIFLKDSVTVYDYAASENKWYKDTSKVHLFPRSLPGDLFFGEWSFAREDSCVYATDKWSDKVWKISK